MEKLSEITVPTDVVNDKTVLITEWTKEHGDEVSAGEILVYIETTKAVLEVEAETDGYLAITSITGEIVKTDQVIGYILSEIPLQFEGGETDPEVEGAAFTAKALEAIDQAGIDPRQFTGKGIVKEADVWAFIENEGGYV